ncbi:hypothetical protein R1flu_017725 [Riccia fluitans]|uniref:Uncharacterized protein n=1 Tax=Riccia fluitans TaxID=41844 RepID=A0ABD1ZET6_9MARC
MMHFPFFACSPQPEHANWTEEWRKGDILSREAWSTPCVYSQIIDSEDNQLKEALEEEKKSRNWKRNEFTTFIIGHS